MFWCRGITRLYCDDLRFGTVVKTRPAAEKNIVQVTEQNIRPSLHQMERVDLMSAVMYRTNPLSDFIVNRLS